MRSTMGAAVPCYNTRVLTAQKAALQQIQTILGRMCALTARIGDDDMVLTQYLATPRRNEMDE